MSAENNSPSLNIQMDNSDKIPPNSFEQSEQALNNSNFNLEDKKSSKNQEVNEQDPNNFNISFFLPKELCKNIEGDDEVIDNKTNNMFESTEQINNDFNQNNDFEFSNNNNNNKYLEFNKNNNILNIQSNKEAFINNNNENILEFNNSNNDELNNIWKRENYGNNYFSTNTNINNFFIQNNNNNTNQNNIQFNNNPFFNNMIYQQNNQNLINNFNKMSNNYPLHGNVNGLNAQNNNYLMNNNEYSNYFSKNPFQHKNIQEAQNTTNKQRKKKVIDEYTIEMFGRRGWICDLCNNFNYDTRKKCNRCHILKKPKKIEEYLQAEKNKSLAHKHFWHCKYCGNYNYAFRLICNRCQTKREIS